MADIEYISDFLNKPGVEGKRQTRGYIPLGNSIGGGAQLGHNRQGRPRIADFPCSKCGQDALVCRSTGKQGSLTVRYYKCVSCGHRGVLITDTDCTWWKNTNCGLGRPVNIGAYIAPEKYRRLALFEWCM